MLILSERRTLAIMSFSFRRRWLWAVVPVLFVPLYYGYTAMDNFLWSQRELEHYFRNKAITPVAHQLVWNDGSVHYMTAGADSLPVILFIHGAPGGWTDYTRYFGDTLLLQQARLIAYDRPGYGRSGCGKAHTSLDKQVQVAVAILRQAAPNKPFIVVGHSYGGPIAARLAMLQPQNLRALVLIAPAIDPENEKQFAINRIITALPVLQQLLPCSLLSAYHEKMTHVAELKLMASDWSRISVPTYYMYGKHDNIVPPVNVVFAQKMIKAPLYITEFPKGNHFLPWNQRDSVRSVLLRALHPNFEP